MIAGLEIHFQNLAGHLGDHIRLGHRLHRPDQLRIKNNVLLPRRFRRYRRTAFINSLRFLLIQKAIPDKRGCGDHNGRGCNPCSFHLVSSPSPDYANKSDNLSL